MEWTGLGGFPAPARLHDLHAAGGGLLKAAVSGYQIHALLGVMAPQVFTLEVAVSGRVLQQVDGVELPIPYELFDNATIMR